MSPQNNARASGTVRPRVLLLHPEDSYPLPKASKSWDLIVDFGHAARRTHEDWSRSAGCGVLSLFDFSADVEDLYRVRELFGAGMGRLVDRLGIDWWDVLSMMVAPDFLNLLMIPRMGAELPVGCELYMSRPIQAAKALSQLTGAPLYNLQNRGRAVLRQAAHYFHVVSKFHPAQTRQIFQDKFDDRHQWRRRLARRPQSEGKPVVLLPSAYSNVSRTAVSFARAFPEDSFLLVYAKAIARLESLPANVRASSLDSYFTHEREDELAALSRQWSTLREELVSGATEFQSADATGILAKIPEFLPWGVAMRDAWQNFFDSENVIACLSADDSNPYTRLPLILAKQRRIPALAIHHGALDYMMVVKTNYADVYLAKSEMERDYLTRVCHIVPEVIGLAPVQKPAASGQPEAPASSPAWLVFFSEYSTAPWRGDEIYRELMPALASLADRCGLRLVFKIHPFENRANYEKWVGRYLPGESGRKAMIISGPPSAELWSKTRFALTAQSTTAVECHKRKIPVFLCAWLRTLSCGYQEQYARFGVGQVLQTPQQIEQIPQMLESWKFAPPAKSRSDEEFHPIKLHDLFHRRAVSQV